jgi:hypothetical protein
MDTQMLDIKDLVKHILKQPNIKHPMKHFVIDKYLSEYGDTKIRPKSKEHKLWTPFKDLKYQKYRCFLMIQLSDNTLIIHHLLDGAENCLRNKDYASFTFSQPQTFASERGDKDQFIQAIEISLNSIGNEEACIEVIEHLIIDITDETIRRGLNLRRRTGQLNPGGNDVSKSPGESF